MNFVKLLICFQILNKETVVSSFFTIKDKTVLMEPGCSFCFSSLMCVWLYLTAPDGYRRPWKLDAGLITEGVKASVAVSGHWGRCYSYNRYYSIQNYLERKSDVKCLRQMSFNCPLASFRHKHSSFSCGFLCLSRQTFASELLSFTEAEMKNNIITH